MKKENLLKQKLTKTEIITLCTGVAVGATLTVIGRKVGIKMLNKYSKKGLDIAADLSPDKKRVIVRIWNLATKGYEGVGLSKANATSFCEKLTFFVNNCEE